MRLPWVLVALTACASTRFETVPSQDWQTVPASERATLDHAHDTEIVRARTELSAATTAYTAAVRDQKVIATKPAMAPDSDPSLREYEQLRTQAVGRIETARIAFLRSNLLWRRARLDAATIHVELAQCDRELDRARAIDRHLPESDDYDLSPYRGQWANAQQRWWEANQHAVAARVDLVRASANLASAKEEYAQLITRGPGMPEATGLGALRLAGFTAEPPPRKGLHVINTAAVPPCRADGRCEATYLTIR